MKYLVIKKKLRHSKKKMQKGQVENEDDDEE
jgi:hypothetical protein